MQAGLDVLQRRWRCPGLCRGLKVASQRGGATQRESRVQFGCLLPARKGVAQDLSEAAKWYHKAAELGYPRAQSNLGVCYFNGWGVDKDQAAAAAWYKRAADQGYARAQRNLGVCFAVGAGVGKDPGEAVRWYRKAAEQGDAGAQYNLGVAYYKARGTAKNDEEAVKWFRLAAEQGYAASEFNLGVCLLNGEGVVPDGVEACKWISMAAAQGYADAKNALPTIQGQLTPNRLPRHRSWCGPSSKPSMPTKAASTPTRSRKWVEECGRQGNGRFWER